MAVRAALLGRIFGFGQSETAFSSPVFPGAFDALVDSFWHAPSARALLVWFLSVACHQGPCSFLFLLIIFL